MAKISPKQTQLLARIFEESEKSKLSDNDLDQELNNSGIDPNALVSEGLNIVNKFTQNNSLLEKKNSLPMAASNMRAESAKDEILRLLNEKKKPKDQ